MTTTPPPARFAKRSRLDFSGGSWLGHRYKENWAGRLNRSTLTWAWLCQSLGLFGACAELWFQWKSLFCTFSIIIAHKWTSVNPCLGPWGHSSDWISCWVISGAALVLCAISHFSTNVWVNPFMFVLCSVSFRCLRPPVFLAGSSLTWPLSLKWMSVFDFRLSSHLCI